MNKLIALILLLLSAPLYAELVDIGNEELQAMLARGVTIIDIRTPGEWQSTGIVEGSHKIMAFDEKRRINPPEWAAKIRAIAGPEQELILICRSGNRSRTMGNYLIHQQGYTQVYNVQRGIKGWKKAGLPVVPVTEK